MARTRTTKKLAQRIDLSYFQRPNPMRRLQFALSVAIPALALLWILVAGIAGNRRVYYAGRLSRSHAVLTDQCGACHLTVLGAFRRHAADKACLACHDGPAHQVNQVFTPSCVSCHVEHRGEVRLAVMNDGNCVSCHGNLKIRGGGARVGISISSFAADHPQFPALRPGRKDPGTIKLNHFVHLRADLKGPRGPVQLECGDCHRPAAVQEAWRFGDGQARAVSAASVPSRELATTRRERMAPPNYAQNCSACHLLQFDKRFAQGAPHDKPDIVHAFVVKKFQEYIAANPAELRVVREPDRNIPGKPIPPLVRVLTPAQWIAERTGEAETLLWKKTCNECHALSFAAGAALPSVAASNITARWLPGARFDHDAHRGFSCTSCHAGAPASRETADILIPGIATCRDCHAPGENHAESRCFGCHTYHDWSKRKEVRPSFSVPGLHSESQGTEKQSGR
jgi:hypothetical protein